MNHLSKQPSIAMSIQSNTSGSSNLNEAAKLSQNAESDEQVTSSSISSSLSNNDTTNNWDHVINSLVAGAIAGAIAKTTIAPLDRTKINFQIQSNTPYTFLAAVEFLKKTYQKEGIVALWRGNSATMARIVPYAAIQFTAHEQWRRILKVDQDGANTKGRRYLAGSLAGITSQSMTYPLDLARARMAVTDKYTGYKTLRQVFIKIWIDEGPRALYRGYWATILGVIPYAGTSFFTYETLKREYYEATGNSKPNSLISLGFGAVAGVVGQTSSYPLDIVRRRMQTHGIKNNNGDQCLTIYETLVKIYREEGIKNGFYKGLSMNWIKGPIAVGISFSTYDLIKELLRELMHLKRGRFEK